MDVRKLLAIALVTLIAVPAGLRGAAAVDDEGITVAKPMIDSVGAILLLASDSKEDGELVANIVGKVLEATRSGICSEVIAKKSVKKYWTKLAGGADAYFAKYKEGDDKWGGRVAKTTVKIEFSQSDLAYKAATSFLEAIGEAKTLAGGKRELLAKIDASARAGISSIFLAAKGGLIRKGKDVDADLPKFLGLGGGLPPVPVMAPEQIRGLFLQDLPVALKSLPKLRPTLRGDAEGAGRLTEKEKAAYNAVKGNKDLLAQEGITAEEEAELDKMLIRPAILVNADGMPA